MLMMMLNLLLRTKLPNDMESIKRIVGFLHRIPKIELDVDSDATLDDQMTVVKGQKGVVKEEC